MKRYSIALLLGAMVPIASWSHAQQNDPAVPPVTGVAVFQDGPVSSTGPSAIVVTSSGAAWVAPLAGAAAQSPVTMGAVALPATTGQKPLMVFRGGAFGASSPAAVAAVARQGGGTVWISSANATLAGKAEKTAFLGVVTTRVTGTLRSQLKLKAGLAVESVEPKSSAEAAGLQAHDIIEKCDDQWLINPAQFVGLLRMYKPGESVTLTVLREGDRKKITAKLEERETYAVDDEGDAVFAKSGTIALNGLPGPMTFSTSGGGGGFGSTGPVQRIWTGALGTAPLKSGFVATFGDDKRQLMITMRDGHQILTVMDPSGKQIFQGPIDTPEQRKAVPESVRKTLEDMEQIKIKIRPLNSVQSEPGPETRPAP
jgi:hypothetical protein